MTREQADATYPRVTVWLLALLIAWVTLQAFGLFDAVHDATLVLLFAGSVAAIAFGIHRYQPAVRWPWFMAMLALTLFFLGGVARQAMGSLGDLSADRSLVPDMLTIPGYIAMGIGLYGVTRARQPDGSARVDAMLDALVAALAAMTLAWIFLVSPGLVDTDAPLSVRITLSLYPALSAFLVAMVAQMLFTSRGGSPLSLKLVLSAMVGTLVGDTVYMLVETGALDLPQRLVDLPYAVGTICFIAAMLHPSMGQVTDPAPSERSRPTLTTARLIVLGVALAIPAVVTVTRGDTSPEDRVVLGAIVLLLTAAAVGRLIRALRAHARSEGRLEYQAYHDSLTGLPNRAQLQERLSDALQDPGGTGGGTALLFLDIDRFKLVNDSHGHSRGDELLRAVAARLGETSRPGDLLAHLGGDEFVILLPSVASTAEAHDVAERTRLCFSVPFYLRASEVSCSVSIGVAVTDGKDPGVDAETLLREADTAVYEAKAAGRDRVTIFDGSMRDRVAKRLALEGDLRHALERNQLHLEYQPIVSLPSGRVEGFEALLRWSHPTMGAISPASFIPVAEDTGLIVPIGAWVLEQACRQVARWRQEFSHASDLSVAVNLSARQLHDEQLLQRVRETLVAAGLPGRALTLELTESVLMDNPPEAADLLAVIRRLGVQLAIDDFGTGYSSLSYLRQFPTDHVKIDRSFVSGLDREGGSESSLVAAIIAMAGALGISTIAEGVEHAAQAARLQSLGCRLAQGYFYSRPVPPDEVPALVQRLTGDDEYDSAGPDETAAG